MPYAICVEKRAGGSLGGWGKAGHKRVGRNCEQLRQGVGGGGGHSDEDWGGWCVGNRNLNDLMLAARFC